MHRYRYSRLAGLLAVALGLSACDDLLQGPGLTENPNSPFVATKEQLFVGVQARQFTLQSGQLARTASIWTQQIAGVFNQQREWGSQYNQTENDLQGHYAGFYIGGGLKDIRAIQDSAVAHGDRRLHGMMLAWEGFSMGTAASLWGDIVYREALNEAIATPQLDPQEQVYADVQAVLDRALAEFAAAPAGEEALPYDLVYNGNVERWVKAVNTMKARFFLHVAPRHGAAAYTAALAAAQNGIDEAPATATQAMHGQAPGDFRTWHGSTLDDANIWSQFNEARTDLAANERFVNVLKARNDPRLGEYFAVSSDTLMPYGGANRFGLAGLYTSGQWSLLNTTTRVSRQFRQPLLTWAENQLIMAEAHFQLGQTGPARDALNRVRNAVGLADVPAPVTLEQIMVEKWIVQFQNIDVYSDWRRTCFPRLVPSGTTPATQRAEVPGRYAYGANERLQNPNIPLPSAAPAKNWNYREITCPSTGGTF